MVLIILFNIFFPIILNKIRYNRAQELKFKEYATYCAVYIEEKFNQKELFIPSTYKDKPIKEIETLNSCDSLEKITLPETITEIKAEAFKNCENLKTIIAHKDMRLEVIGISAFDNCKNLTNLDFDFSNLNSLGSRAFANCESFTYMDLSQSSLTKVPTSCFSLCYSLKEVRLPNIIQTIDKYAFFKCTSLEKFDMPDATNIIEEQAFSFCEKLSILTFTNYSNLFSIGNDAFNGCAIKSLTLPYGTAKLGTRAFANNDISYLDLPQTIETINTRAFFGNEILTLIINFHNPYIIGGGKYFGEKFGFNDTDSSSDIYIKINLVVYVPASSYNDFVSAWKNYTVEKKLSPQ